MEKSAKNYCVHFTAFYILHYVCCTGLFVALISEGHMYVVEPGETVSLECNFHADQYDLFEYPVLWRKTQHLEDSQVNVMGTLMEPFSQRHRFEVTFDAFDSRYRLMLHIHGSCYLSLHHCAVHHVLCGHLLCSSVCRIVRFN